MSSKYEKDMIAARSKIFSLVMDSRQCINSKGKNKSDTFQLKTKEYDVGEVHDILVPAYLKIYHRHHEKTGQEGLTLLECWKIFLESDTYAKKSERKVDVLKKLLTCTRAVCSFLRLMPSHKLIGEKTKLNLAFDIEYKIMDKFDKTEFKPGHLLIKEQSLGNFFTDSGIFSISVIYAFDLGHLMVKRTNVIEIENYDNYTQESGRQYIRHNSVGNTPIKSPYNGKLSVPNQNQLPIEQQLTPQNIYLTDRQQSRKSERSRDNNTNGKGTGRSPSRSFGIMENSLQVPPIVNSRKQDGPIGPFRSSQTHSPVFTSSPTGGIDPKLTLMDDHFILETPANPSFNLLQLNSISPFRDNPMSRSPFGDYDDTDEISGRSASFTPVFKVTHWKEMGLSPSMRSTSSTSKIDVSSSPANTIDSYDPGSKLDNFINIIQNPPSHLLKDTETKLTIADYAATLDKLIGSS